MRPALRSLVVTPKSAVGHFDLVSHWRFQAPVERVWQAIANPHGWPSWWPYVRKVETRRPGDARGVGAVLRIDWKTRLPHGIAVEVETFEIVRPDRIRARARGELRGEGIWLLRPEGDFTDVTYVWRIEVTKPWMRWLAPVLAPVFRWNHDAVMAAGERGLAALLARDDHPEVRRSGTTTRR